MRAEKSDLQIETIVSRIDAKELDLQPDFQRGEIWDIKRRKRLIDTVLRNWFIPAIHIVVDKDNAEVVLDGQQRLVAIRDFLHDEFPVDGMLEPDDAVIQPLDGMRFSELPEGTRRAFLRFTLPVVTLRDFKPQEPNELFFRLNQSYNLTPSEKRNALHGEARDQIRDLVKEVTKMGLLNRDVVGFTNSRLAYDDIMARVCVAIQKGTLRDHINNTTVETFYRGQAFDEKTISRVSHASRELLGQIDLAPNRAKFNKGTLQTWLIYCVWAPASTGAIPPELLGAFESVRSGLRSGAADQSKIEPSILDLVRMYDDRASYRVTDVSSVVIRDAALHLFSQYFFSTGSRKGSSELLANLASQHSESTQTIFTQYLEAARWGEPLLEGYER